MTIETTRMVRRRPKPKKEAQSRPTVVAAHLLPGLIGLLAFVVAPVVGAAVISFYQWPLYGETTFVGIQNYLDIFTKDPFFWRVLFNTVLFAFAFTLLNILVALGLALWIKSIDWFQGFWRTLFMLSYVTPMVANALVWRLLLDDRGVVNSMLDSVGLPAQSWLGDGNLAMMSMIAMSVWQGIGTNVIVLAAALNGINPSILEAAALDGVGRWGRLTKVTLPMISPAIFFITVMTLMNAFKVFVQPLQLTRGGPGDATNTLVLYLYRQGFSFDKLGYASSLAWTLMALIGIVTAIQFWGQKKWVNYDA